MKFCTFSRPPRGTMRPGVLTSDGAMIVDLSHAFPGVSGETWCDSNSSTIHHKFEDLLARVSADETVHPGEFFGSGTVGDGCGLQHGRYLKDGDVVELEVEKIGVLRNRVVRQKQPAGEEGLG